MNKEEKINILIGLIGGIVCFLLITILFIVFRINPFVVEDTIHQDKEGIVLQFNEDASLEKISCGNMTKKFLEAGFMSGEKLIIYDCDVYKKFAKEVDKK